jgi:hypothetical protein
MVRPRARERLREREAVRERFAIIYINVT